VIVENKPVAVLANVNTPTLKDNKIFLPLIRFDENQTWMEATICFYLIKHGYSWEEIKTLRGNIPKQWTARKVVDYINLRGECVYQEVKREESFGGDA